VGPALNRTCRSRSTGSCVRYLSQARRVNEIMVTNRRFAIIRTFHQKLSSARTSPCSSCATGQWGRRCRRDGARAGIHEDQVGRGISSDRLRDRGSRVTKACVPSMSGPPSTRGSHAVQGADEGVDDAARRPPHERSGAQTYTVPLRAHATVARHRVIVMPPTDGPVRGWLGFPARCGRRQLPTPRATGTTP